MPDMANRWMAFDTLCRWSDVVDLGRIVEFPLLRLAGRGLERRRGTNCALAQEFPAG
jgi:hypothetical protein